MCKSIAELKEGYDRTRFIKCTTMYGEVPRASIKNSLHRHFLRNVEGS